MPIEFVFFPVHKVLLITACEICAAVVIATIVAVCWAPDVM